jgi:KipI family sensor histidine kinase inhibitor
MRFLPVNLEALLVELEDLPQTLALLTSLQAEPIAAIEEIVPAARTLMISYRPSALSRAALIKQIAARPLKAALDQAGELIEIPISYEGEDLQDVARLLGITPAELVRRHTGSDYRVAFTGFAPGFAYLSGGHASLQVPRRATPRTRIPAGSVGLAGNFSGIYPQASPGGWQIIGVTATPMWDLSREHPALLRPGQRVRFVNAGPQVAAPAAPAAAAAPIAEGCAALEIRRSGLQALIQDLGRHGHASQGVSSSGAMDRGALRAANRLVGNAVDAPGIEIVHGGFELQCRGDAVVAVTGAQGPLELIAPDGRRWPLPRHAPLALADGDRLLLGEPVAGLRSYLAARGGLVLSPVLGSSSTDTLARLGPPALAAGDVLALRPPASAAPVGGDDTPATLPTLGEPVTLDVVMGPRTDWFTVESIARLCSQDWTVTPQSNRVGLRLEGAQALNRCAASVGAELPSEGTRRGSIQVPPNGQPVLFMADHPLTGGYPVIGSIAPYHLDRAGQLPVGARLRLRCIAEFTQEIR